MELNDIYDENRNLTGKLHRRGTPWKPGEYGVVVCVWVYDGRGHLLLTRRAREKSFAGTWENSGGAVKAGETSRQAIAQAGTGSSSVFSVVTLSSGQTLVGDVGCEIMLRIGSATCGSDGSTGLIDVTDGSTLSDGENLVTNHLYMVTISTRSVTATAGTTKLLVRGPYTIQ